MPSYASVDPVLSVVARMAFGERHFAKPAYNADVRLPKPGGKSLLRLAESHTHPVGICRWSCVTVLALYT